MSDLEHWGTMKIENEEELNKNIELMAVLEELIKSGLTRQHLEEQLEQDKVNHEGTQFYSRARNKWLDIQGEQISKGKEKYPEPFNPKSWSADELINHAMQENVDQAHYMVGLYELLKDKEQYIKTLEETVKSMRTQINAHNSFYGQ